MNKTNTFAFSIIREPVSLFYSTFAYFKEDVAAFLKPNTPKEFFDNTGEYYVKGIDGFVEYNKTEKARLKELQTDDKNERNESFLKKNLKFFHRFYAEKRVYGGSLETIKCSISDSMLS